MHKTSAAEIAAQAIRLSDTEPFYSETNQEYLRKSLEDYKNGKLIKHELIEAYDE